MVRVRVYLEEISRSGQVTEELAAAFTVQGRDLVLEASDAQHVNLGLPVFSDERGGFITFTDAPEEWASLLPTAYRNGAIRVEAQAV